MQATSQPHAKNVAGTHEIRRKMRHQTHANRVHFGTSICVTFSPSERDNTLMMKLTRARRCDPALNRDDT
eukprot:6214828-Amphidinium_carterae.1